jgi:chromosome segregation ATPase
MAKPRPRVEVRVRVRELARGFCEYCRIEEATTGHEFTLTEHRGAITRADEQIRSLELSANEIKNREVSSTAITNFFNSTNAEISNLRTRVDALSASSSSMQTSLNHHHDELAKTTNRITAMPDLRKRLAIVETTLKHISGAEEQKRPSSSAASRNP